MRAEIALCGRTARLGDRMSFEVTGTILFIDDDEALLELVGAALRRNGFSVVAASSGEEGLALLRQVAPDLVILDIMMPGVNGWTVCRQVRAVSCVPIMFLTALADVDDVVRGLSEGADDFLTKPFDLAELRARVTSLLLRTRRPPHRVDTLRFRGGDLIISRVRRTILVSGEEVHLSPTEYELFLVLTERAGHILSVRELCEAIWGYCDRAERLNLRRYVWRLRQKIEPTPKEPRFILTEPGRGYRFSPL